jgi:GntR family transcriptional regulator/MocR family aminotransferase
VAAAGVAVRPLADYRVASAEDSGVRLVIGYAQLAPSDIVRGVRLMAEAAMP